MKVKNISKFLIIMLVSLLLVLTIASAYSVQASSTQAAIDAMSKMNETVSDTSGKLGGIINAVIGFIQIAGTGISMIMVTILGIRYMMAAPSDKADVKKQIAPMIIGAIILFGAVNLVNIVANVAMKSLEKANGDT